MLSFGIWLNALTGISQGSFDKIYLRDTNGNMGELLTLIGAKSGGTVTSATGSVCACVQRY